MVNPLYKNQTLIYWGRIHFDQKFSKWILLFIFFWQA